MNLSTTSLAIAAAAFMSPPWCIAVDAGGIFSHNPFGKGPSQLPPQTAAAMGLHRGRQGHIPDLDRCKAMDGKARPCTLLIPDETGRPHAVDLVPHSVRAANFELLVQDTSGQIVNVDPGKATTTYMYRGIYDDGSVVAASIVDNEITMTIPRKNEGTLYVEPVNSSTNNNHAVYTVVDVMERPEVVCGAIDVPDHPDRNLVGENAEEDNIGEIYYHPLHQHGSLRGHAHLDERRLTTTLKIAELAIDVDYEYFTAYNSSVAAVQARVESIINQINFQYEREVGIAHVITAIIVRASAADQPYTSTKGGDLLTQFRDEWKYHHTNIQRDVAQ